MKKTISTSIIIKTSLLAFFVVCVFFPMISMFARMDARSIIEMVNSKRFALALKNSFFLSFCSSCLSISFAFLFAYVISRVDFKYKGVFVFILTLPMLIPSISHSFSLVALFGSNGFFTKILKLKFLIYGRKGIIIGSIMYSFPLAFLMIYNILKYEDTSVYQAAFILGIPKFYRILRITLPYVMKMLIFAFFAVFTMVITDYGIPLVIGGKTITLPVLMYNEVLGKLDFASGSVIGTILLLPAFIAFLLEFLVTSHSTISNINKREYEELSPISKYVLRFFLLFFTFVTVVPILVFCIVAFSTKYPKNISFTIYHIVRTLQKGGCKFLINSVTYSIFAATFGSIVAFICAYISSRYRDKLSKVLHFLILITMSIPGIVLGLSYTIFFSRSVIYGTMFIIVLANMLHFLTSPYLMMYHSLEKVNSNIEFVGLTLGIKRIKIIKDVIIPKIKPTIIEVFSYFFVNSMMTISAVSFLAPPSPRPISLMISQFEAQLLIESAAFVSLLVFFVNFIVKIVFVKLQQREDRKLRPIASCI